MIAASDIERVTSAPPHVRFFTQERGSWHGSLAAEWRETLWQFDGQSFEFVDDLSISVS